MNVNQDGGLRTETSINHIAYFSNDIELKIISSIIDFLRVLCGPAIFQLHTVPTVIS